MMNMENHNVNEFEREFRNLSERDSELEAGLNPEKFVNYHAKILGKLGKGFLEGVFNIPRIFGRMYNSEEPDFVYSVGGFSGMAVSVNTMFWVPLLYASSVMDKSKYLIPAGVMVLTNLVGAYNEVYHAVKNDAESSEDILN